MHHFQGEQSNVPFSPFLKLPKILPGLYFRLAMHFVHTPPLFTPSVVSTSGLSLWSPSSFFILFFFADAAAGLF